MKKLLFWISICVSFSLMCSCEEKKSLFDFDFIDSIAQDNPKSASEILKGIKRKYPNMSEGDKMKCALLDIKVKDRLYANFETDSLVMQIVSYYTDHYNECKLAEAYYYAGKVYANMNDAPRALEYYQKSLGLTPEENVKRKSSIYSKIGRLYTFQSLHAKALYMYKKSLSLDLALHDSVNIIHSLKDIAYTFSKLVQRDSSLLYYEKAACYAKALHNVHLYNLVSAQMASLYIDMGRYEDAKCLLQPSLKENDSVNMSSHYAMALKIYASTDNIDSTNYYAYNLLRLGTIYAKQTATRYLSLNSLKKGNFANAQKYMLMYYKLTDSIKSITATDAVARMSALYNYNLREKENLELKVQNANNRFVLVVIVSFCVVVLILVLLLLYRNRQRQKEQLKKIARLRKKIFCQSDEAMKKNNQIILNLETEIQMLNNKNVALVAKLEEQRQDLVLANETIKWNKTKQETIKIRICSSEIYKRIQEFILKKKVLQPADWDKLHVMLNQEIDNFKASLLSYHNISEHEYHVCMLIKIGTTPSDMSDLLGCTPSAVSKVRTRLQEKFFGKSGGAKEFDEFVNSL